MQFICGVERPEDLVRLGKTKWVIATSFQMPGPLRAIAIDTHEVRTLYPAADATANWDRKLYPGCSTPPQPLSTHGLAIRRLSAQRFRVYAINHGQRQSIEIVDVEMRDGKPRAAWRGCVLAPASTWTQPTGGPSPNGVAPLAGDDFVIAGGAKTGVAIWRAGRGWSEISAAPKGTNGVETSPARKWIFVAVSNAETVVRFAADADMSELQTVAAHFHTDNLRWGEDGLLYVAGPIFGADGASNCLKGSCDVGFGVMSIDPKNLQTREIMRSDGIPGVFGGATTALRVGNELWLGSFIGDRIAIIPASDVVRSVIATDARQP